MAITDWPQAERPREKLLARGAGALSDAELLAIFLRVGIKGRSAVDLARDLLTHYGSLTRLFAASQQSFNAQPGMGTAKYAQLQAVMELARRALGENLKARDLLSEPQTVRDWLRLHLGACEHEIFCLLLLDKQNQLIELVELFRGTLGEACVYPREVLKTVLEHNAAAVILVHNHPSGKAEASAEDRQLTRTLQEALRLIEVPVLDHFIVTAQDEPLSFAEKNWL